MKQFEQLKAHGLFEAKVPRYTSYPPANHFATHGGRDNISTWLGQIPGGEEISLYVHIPFCKRLCWFCACRTQGTQNYRPVETYIKTLIKEVRMIRAAMSDDLRLSRLHLGGGTPTILTPETMSLLLDTIFAEFEIGEEFEFSVEIDPTEASDALLGTLMGYGMNRASIGVQDFDPAVQKSIGRIQSYEQTRHVVNLLRAQGQVGLNMDVLYGLPHQTAESLSRTIEKVLSLRPDRLALYGYAHVPWMSKRQVMIDAEALPDGPQRYQLAQLAAQKLEQAQYLPIGIDHFALASDGLAKAVTDGMLRRNFQGYTDDPARVLVGLGASAISQFPQGFSQNAAATSAYAGRIEAGELAAQRGFVLSADDVCRANAIDQLMCHFELDLNALRGADDAASQVLARELSELAQATDGLCMIEGGRFRIKPEARPLVRIIANRLDQYSGEKHAHSLAI